MRFINEHVLSELARFRGHAFNPQEREFFLGLLPQHYADMASEGLRSIRTLELLQAAGLPVAPLFEHFVKTMERLAFEDERFKQIEFRKYTTELGKAHQKKSPVQTDLFSNPVLHILLPVHYGEELGVSEPRTIAGYLNYLKQFGS